MALQKTRQTWNRSWPSLQQFYNQSGRAPFARPPKRGFSQMEYGMIKNEIGKGAAERRLLAWELSKNPSLLANYSAMLKTEERLPLKYATDVLCQACAYGADLGELFPQMKDMAGDRKSELRFECAQRIIAEISRNSEKGSYSKKTADSILLGVEIRDRLEIHTSLFRGKGMMGLIFSLIERPRLLKHYKALLKNGNCPIGEAKDHFNRQNMALLGNSDYPGYDTKRLSDAIQAALGAAISKDGNCLVGKAKNHFNRQNMALLGNSNYPGYDTKRLSDAIQDALDATMSKGADADGGGKCLFDGIHIVLGAAYRQGVGMSPILPMLVKHMTAEYGAEEGMNEAARLKEGMRIYGAFACFGILCCFLDATADRKPSKAKIIEALKQARTIIQERERAGQLIGYQKEMLLSIEAVIPRETSGPA
ncbi:MAG: hypothetical protein WC861_04250 [Candidatus Micrarchaeia archaeon]